MADCDSKQDAFKVFVRSRPLNEREILCGSRKKAVTINQPSGVTLTDADSREVSMNFDLAFGEHTTNEQIFMKTVKPLIEHFSNGYNSTVFAYGITGAGKSYTMFGDGSSKPGIIPYTFSYILNNLRDCRLRMSYLQVYNEQVFDLLVDNSENLQVLEDSERGVVVMDLVEREVETAEEANDLIVEGNHRRVMAQTNANEFSSRSHALVLISIERVVGDKIITAKLSMVDLAGSEKGTVYENNKAIRSLEGSNINKSLLALGNCIMMLSDGKKVSGFVPYRDSKLTRLLKDSLGGNTKTVMIACISPSALTLQETVNTLKYAGRARKIEKTIHQNVKQSNELPELKAQILRLQQENQMLREELQSRPKLNKQMSQMLSNLIQNVRESVHLQNMLGGGEDEVTLEEIERNQKDRERMLKQFLGQETSPKEEQYTESLSGQILDMSDFRKEPLLKRMGSSTKDKENRMPIQLSSLRSKMCRLGMRVEDEQSDPGSRLVSEQDVCGQIQRPQRLKHLESLKEVRKMNERMAMLRGRRQLNDQEYLEFI